MEIVGLNKNNVLEISRLKQEEDWVREFRVQSYENFCKLGMPDFGPKIELDFDKIIYYKANDKDMKNSWDEIDTNVKKELDNLGVLESEKHLDGMGVQYESEVI